MSPSKKPTSPPGAKRVLIVDDHPMMRLGLAQLIEDEPNLSLCGEAENAAQALEAIQRLKPDLVLADISLPDKNGLELIKDFLAIQPRLEVLVVSMHDESLYAERVLRAGGRGYIMKQEGGKKLMEAIRQVMSGGVYVSEKISARILESLAGRRDAGPGAVLRELTDREFQVFRLLGEGKGTRNIAEALHLSIKTVEVHRANIKSKLGISTAPELIRHAVRWIETQKAEGGL
jgi:DNA-binding NarL/FixJ family response regulator